MNIILEDWKTLKNHIGQKHCIYDECASPLIESLDIKNKSLSDYGKFIILEDLLLIIENLMMINHHCFLHEALHNYFQGPTIGPEAITVNIPSANRISLKGACEQVEDDGKGYIFCSSQELLAKLGRDNQVIRALEMAKIMTSSFFLSEFLNVFPVKIGCTLKGNMFFRNLENLITFLGEIKFHLQLPSEHQNFREALCSCMEDESIVQIPMGNLRLHLPYLYAPKVRLYTEKDFVFSDQWSFIGNQDVNFKGSMPQRKVEWYSEVEVGNSYGYYMYYICKLHGMSLDRIILRNVCAYWNSKQPLLEFIDEPIKEYIKSLKEEIIIVEEKPFLKGIPLVPILNTGKINDIKHYMRSRKSYKFYIADLKERTIELFSVRSVKKNFKLSLTY